MSEKKEKEKGDEVVETDLLEEEEEIELGPPKDLTLEGKRIWIRNLPFKEGSFESPIDLSLTSCIPLQMPLMTWVNFESIPKKCKITNTGHTLLFSARWKEERPYICNGPIIGKYVFSNFHLHWGKNSMKGSEHSTDGGNSPAEMHVVFFKSSYLTQEAALKEQDGCVTLVYILQLQEANNPGIQLLIDPISEITTAGVSTRIESICILRLFREFHDDYFMYWGTVNTEDCTHVILWLITRKPMGISHKQLDALRTLLDDNGEFLTSNYREVKPRHNRSVFHVNPSSSLHSTLHPLTHDMFLQYYFKVFYYKDISLIDTVVESFLNDSDTNNELENSTSIGTITSTNGISTSDETITFNDETEDEDDYHDESYCDSSTL